MSLNDISMPEPRNYSHKDLYPSERDSRCHPEFPLASYWPVYVGNFWCLDSEHVVIKVQEYFASKGLLVRMVFSWKDAKHHFRYQKGVHLFDFLVYFVRKQDADDAVLLCHRDMYYEHRLNVFPGRDPVYFDETRTLKFMLNSYFSEATEQMLEEIIYEKTEVTEVDCVVKNAKLVAYVELFAAEDIRYVIKPGKILHVQIEQTTEKVRKQLFLEQDVEQQITTACTSSPNFMQMVPPDYILQALFQGRIPDTGRRLPNRMRSVRYPRARLNAEEYRENKEDEKRYMQPHYYSNFENPLGEFVDELKNCRPDEEYAQFVRQRRLAILAKGK